MRRESVKEAYGCVPPMNTRSLERRDEMLIWILLGCDVDHSVDKALRCSGSEQELDLVLKVFLLNHQQVHFGQLQQVLILHLLETFQ